MDVTTEAKSEGTVGTEALTRPGETAPSGEVLRKAMLNAAIAWMFGAVWFATISGTPVTLYARTLHASPFQFGVLAALPFLASLLSPFSSLLIEATGKRKRIFISAHSIHRTLWIPIALMPWLIFHRWGEPASGVAVNVYLLLILIMYLFAAVGTPAWVAWMADLVPERVRGVYFARRRQWGILTAVPAAWGIGWLLDHYTAGGNSLTVIKWCAIALLIVVPFGFMDIFMFGLVPDVPRPGRKGTHLWASLRGPLHDRNFLWFAAFVGVLQFAMNFMNQFVTLYVMDQAQKAGAAMNRTAMAMLIITPYLAQLMVLGLWGQTADRMGKKPLLVISALALAPVGFGWCFVTGSSVWLGYVLSAAGMAFWAGVEVANFNMVLESSRSCEKGTFGGSGYFAVNSVIVNLCGCMGGLCAGGIAQALRDWRWEVPGLKVFTSYDALFAASGLIRLAAVVVFVPHLYEAMARPTGETLRYMVRSMIEKGKERLGWK